MGAQPGFLYDVVKACHKIKQTWTGDLLNIKNPGFNLSTCKVKHHTFRNRNYTIHIYFNKDNIGNNIKFKYLQWFLNDRKLHFMNENFRMPIHEHQAAFFQFLTQVLIPLPMAHGFCGSDTWKYKRTMTAIQSVAF